MSIVKPEPIEDVLKKVINQLEEKVDFSQDKIYKIWDEAVNKKIKPHARPIGIKKLNLVVNVEDSSWLFELQTKHKGRILKKLQKAMGEDKIKDIRFKIGDTKDAA